MPGPYLDPVAVARRVHFALGELGLTSPAPLVAAVVNHSRWQSGAVTLAGRPSALAARDQMLADVARGRREIDAAALDEYRRTSAWIGGSDGIPSTADVIVAEAIRIAASDVVMALATTAPQIFDTLHDAAAEVVDELAALPPAPHGLWITASPDQILARSAGHEATLSILAKADDRFWRLASIADSVRDDAGCGFAALPPGSPRSAAVYANWREYLAREQEFSVVNRSLRLWFAVANDLRPGIHRPHEIDAPTAQESTFAAKLARLGHAVG